VDFYRFRVKASCIPDRCGIGANIALNLGIADE